MIAKNAIIFYQSNMPNIIILYTSEAMYSLLLPIEVQQIVYSFVGATQSHISYAMKYCCSPSALQYAGCNQICI